MERIFGNFLSGRAAIGLLIIRVIFGIAMASHGMSKIQNPTGWMGPKSTTPGIAQAIAAISEFGGGIALAAGFLTPLATLGIAATMVGAILIGHAGDPWLGKGKTFEMASLYLATALGVLCTGPGVLSLDYLLFQKTRRISDERISRVADSNENKNY
ncbi:MAG TPA: DoxX family protein [Abditibacteriaceae bacterium]|jgi:putative oxidoreductase